MVRNRQDEYIEFRDKYKDFTYEGYTYKINEKEIDIEYNFKINNLIEFKPTWKIGIITKNNNIDKNVLENLIFSLGMVELVSYWKSTCSPNIHINSNELSEEQIKWWKKLYTKGLGEFFYLNNITPEKEYINILQNAKLNKKYCVNKDNLNIDKNKVLIPVGGGKDSIVTIELLKEQFDSYPYIINSRGATTDTVQIAGLEDKTIHATRRIDSNLIKLNKEDFLNGHTPYSAIVAFSSVIAGYINNIGYVSLSNESSANESTVKNTDVNHQYSKSFEFEKDFNDYESMYINSDVKYFSFLRPIKEIQIAQIFSNLKQYHEIFRSCNVGSKSNIWCANCPKCLFVYIILSPYLTEQELIHIFGKNMFENKDLLLDFEKLTGIREEKPFECVGEVEEVLMSLKITTDRYLENNIKLPYLLEIFNTNFKDTNINTQISEIDNLENYIPEKFLKVLKEGVAKNEK